MKPSFDRYDEYGNYYNQNGQPVLRSESEEYEDEDEFEDIEDPDDYEFYYDDLCREYMAGLKDDEPEPDKDLDEKLAAHGKDKDVPLHDEGSKIFLMLKNLAFDIKEKEVLEFFKDQLKDKFKFDKILLKWDKDRVFGTIIVQSKQVADALVGITGKVRKHKGWGVIEIVDRSSKGRRSRLR